MKSLRDIAWEEFKDLDLEEKAEYFTIDSRPYHTLIAQQFDRRQLDSFGKLATKIRFIAKDRAGMHFLQSLLSDKRVMLYFTQPSTRTFLSFCAAGQILGMRTGEVRDTATSSEFKGESNEDSVRTFSSYFDMIVLRSPVGGLAERMAWVLTNSDRPVPIINAGSGRDQHPTQALLDIYTLQRSFENSGGIEGKKIVFVGDLARGRTVRSLSLLLLKYPGVKQCFVSPEKLQIGADILGILKGHGASYEVSNDFESHIGSADAIYMTRLQDEWDKQSGDSDKIDISSFSFTCGHLAKLKDSAILMHPFPRREEIAPEVDQDPRAVYWRQMRNGMWIRSALIATVFDIDEQIMDFEC